MDSQPHQLHFLLIPLMCPGHLIPMIDMSKLLAKHGVTVTIVTTPLNAIRFKPLTDRAIESGLPIKLLQLHFPSLEVGLPEGCENIDAIPSLDMMKNFFDAVGMLQQQLEHFLEQLTITPNCVISDRHIAWVADTAKKFQIPRIIFDGMNCFTLLCTHNLHISKAHESVLSEAEPFVLPGLPDRIEITKAQLPQAFNPSSLDMKKIVKQIQSASKEAYGVVVNSFQELETIYLNEYKKVKSDKVWCIGPLSLCNKDNLDKAQRGNKAAIDEDQCLKWLDAYPPGCVVYACLGSLTRLPSAQLIELGLALEASNRPFIWVVRDKTKEIEKWIVEDGFEERTKGRGLLIRGWAPQVLILSHPAIGGFLTHCGWNSTLEGVCAGVPLITWPLFAEQFLNEKLVVEVLGIGVSVGAQVVVHFGEEEKYGVMVKREGVKEAVEKVMEEGNGEERRKRAREFGEMAKRAIEEGGSSYLNMTLLIQDIMQQANIPLLSQSQLIPMTDFAELLARRGVTVTIITTPLNAIRFKALINRATIANLKIQLVPLRFPCQEAGLPEGCENMDTLTSPESVELFFQASGMLQEPLEKLIEKLEPKPSCIISTNALPWTAKVSQKFKISRFVFHAVSCFTLFCSHNIYRDHVHERVVSDSETFLVPNMPDRIEFTKAQLPKGIAKKSSSNDLKENIADQMKEAELSADGVLVNSFEELEPRYAEEYKKVKRKTLCIGPVSLCNKELSDKFERGNKSSIDEHYCLKWLASMKPSSIIYACFGSLCHIPHPQLIEIGLGLEASNRPFIWIIRGGDYSREIEKWFAEEGFEERTKERGLIIRGWAPQVSILSHPAVGGFLTHCGWNSTMEGICSGVPMITWPMFAEQFYNEKFIVNVLRIGVRIGVEVGMQWGEEDETEVLVKRDQVKKAVDQLMEEGKEGKGRRKRARELAEMAKRTIEEGGSSYLNMTLLIQHVMQQVHHKISEYSSS
ncbi:hypothetical protein F0562_016145 [Nyssa sinensis]|uniref:Glycosyltransferase N-terminal domain-containing protein n=1 Tax=Nyssa sinensis TaxID=561372 RepID=A0A5J4ZNM7_9ASTE|nr:hypothetical protein F0562_016145 [Nyssa sinensis]